MQHFSDPVLSRIQSSMESQLRKQQAELGAESGPGNHNDILAQHTKMQEVTHICAELRKQRRSPHALLPFRKKTVTLKHIDPHSECLEFYCRLALCRLYDKGAEYEALKEEFNFSTCDPKWFEAIDEYFTHFGPGSTHDEIPYVDYQSISDFVCSGLPNNLTVGILGDWGTGQSIAIDQLKKVVEKKPDLIIHLGDVYYAGTEEEYEHKLLNLVDEFARDDQGKPIPFLNMPGNHDMYAGGTAYYKAFERLNKRNLDSKLLNIEQHASYFCIRLKNESWQLIAMDTAYHDHNPFMVDVGMTHVREQEVTWMLDKVENFPGQSILFSHHQPFSPYEEIGSLTHKKPSEFYQNPNLIEIHRLLLSASSGRIPLWIWGHEHNLGIYQPFAGIKRGRCVGHSAVPVLDNKNPYAVRHMPWTGAVDSVWGLLKGKWGRAIHRELNALWRLLFSKFRFATPKLQQRHNKPIMLGKTPDDNMFQQGFAVMRFTENDQSSDVSVEYYAEDTNTPLFSEHINSMGQQP